MAVLVWLAATGDWTACDWRTPAAYRVDALETLARFRQSAEKGGASLLWHPTVARLGAPEGANWATYPLTDAPRYWLTVFALTNLPFLHATLSGMAPGLFARNPAGGLFAPYLGLAGATSS